MLIPHCLAGARDVGRDDDDGTGPRDRQHDLLKAGAVHLVLPRHHGPEDRDLETRRKLHVNVENIEENHGKTIGKPWESGGFMGFSWCLSLW